MSCSYCSSIHHNIRTCNSPLIPTIFDNIRTIYISVINNQLNDDTPNKYRFDTIINRRFTLIQLKVVAMRYLNGYSNWTKSHIIDQLWNYFVNNLMINPQITDANWYRPIPNPPSTPIRRGPTITVLTDDDINDLDTQADEDRHNQSVLIFMNDLVNNLSQIQKIKVVIQEEEEENTNKNKNQIDCPICYDTITPNNKIITNCGHQFCNTCMERYLKKQNKNTTPSCAMCRSNIQTIRVHNQKVFTQMTETCA